MHTCQFCGRPDLASQQSVYAHLKHCDLYQQQKKKKNAALGTSLRQSLPKAHDNETKSSVVPPLLGPSSTDPFAQFMGMLHGAGFPSSKSIHVDETPLQQRRRLLQTAKSQVVDQYWGVPGTITAEMRAAAKLTIEHELRNEVLEEWAPEEVNEVAAGIRDRIYTSFLHQQEQNARRAQTVEERKSRAQVDALRKEIERAKKKTAFIDEGLRRIGAWLKMRSCAPLEQLVVLAEVRTQFDVAFTGAETLSEAQAAIDSVLKARIAEWDAAEARRAAKWQEEWSDLAVAVAGLIALGVMYLKAPELVLWILKVFWPDQTESPGPTDKPPTQAAGQPGDEATPSPPIRRVRRSPTSATPKPPPSPFAP
jgi:hypothetical protein